MNRLSYADKIIVLGNDGTILEEGSFEELSQQQGHVFNLSLQPPDWKYENKPETDSHEDTPFNTISGYIPDQAVLSKEDAEAEASRRTGDLSVYKFYLGSVGWLAAIIFIVMMIAFVFCTTFPSKPALQPSQCPHC